jgi:hypothetical protein
MLAVWNGVLCAEEPANDTATLDQDSLFEAVAWRYGLDASLLRAIATVESARQTRAVSPAGAMGLMQLMPDTARRFRVEDPFDPVDNALGAARFLAYLQRQQLSSKGEANLADLLAAYNAGEGAVKRYQGVPPYAETRGYVRRVLWAYLLAEQPAAVIDAREPSESTDVGARVRHPQPADRALRAPDGSGAGKRSEDDALLRQLAELRRERARASEPEQSARGALEAAR